jgi:hypothetical protein
MGLKAANDKGLFHIIRRDEQRTHVTSTNLIDPLTDTVT